MSTAQLKIFPFNPLQVNTYLIYEQDGPGILIDPSCCDRKEFGQLQDFIELNKIKPEYQLNTHGHFDHLFGAGLVKMAYPTKFLIHEEDKPFLRQASAHAGAFGFSYEGEVPVPDGSLSDGDIITSGSISLQVIHVPGHSRGGVAFYEASKGWLFTGDTLFAGGIGRTDLTGGNYDQLIASIRQKLFTLPEGTAVFPGHGPSSTILNERTDNPYL